MEVQFTEIDEADIDNERKDILDTDDKDEGNDVVTAFWGLVEAHFVPMRVVEKPFDIPITKVRNNTR